MDGHRRIVEGGQAGGESRSAGMVAVFVPPAVFAKVQAVFDAPMVAHVGQEVGGGDLVRVLAGNEVPHVVRDELAGGIADLAINADRYAAAGQIEDLADVRRVVDVDPDPARFSEAPLLLFSVVWAAGGRSGAPTKQWTSASSVSG